MVKTRLKLLFDSMISGGDELVNALKTILPILGRISTLMLHESNVTNLKKIKKFLNK